MTKPLTLFCIDNDQDDLDFFQEALALLSLPCQCTTALSGREALEQLQHVTPDYIFLDINMPGMNGFETLTRISELSHLEHVPIVMLSTSVSTQDRELLMSKGASYCLTKLANFKSFCKTLRALLTGTSIPSEVVIYPK